MTKQEAYEQNKRMALDRFWWARERLREERAGKIPSGSFEYWKGDAIRSANVARFWASDEAPEETLASRLRKKIETQKPRSAWKAGVRTYTIELLDQLEEREILRWTETECIRNDTALHKALLNGASSWQQYSEGGCSLCYDYDIAKRLCSPSTFKRKKEGSLPPNNRENWLDVQARALYQAGNEITHAFWEIQEDGL